MDEANRKFLDWAKQGNASEWLRPLRPGERVNELAPDIMQLIEQSIRNSGG
jgi:hypothetical protein